MCVCVIFSLIDHKPCLFESRPLWHNNSPSDSPPASKSGVPPLVPIDSS